MEEQTEAKKSQFYICAIVKDEHAYVREWALHNKSIGFDKIVLYDNNSSKPYDAELGDLMQHGFVEIRTWNKDSDTRQIDAYNDFVQSENWSETDYCAFIDPDEFIFFDKVKTVSEFIALYPDCAGVGLSWKMYNANGRIEPQKGIPMPEAYVTEFEYPEPRIKPLARLRYIDYFTSPHMFIPSNGLLITTNNEPILEKSPKYKDYTNGHIKHYLTKSWQDWIKRLKRGNVTKGIRTVDLFFVFNPNMEHLRYDLIKDLDFDDFPTIYSDK